MKQYSKKLFSLVVLCSATSVMLQADDNNNNGVVSFIQWRSEGRDMVRKLIGEVGEPYEHIYQKDRDTINGTLFAVVQYDQTFRGKQLSRSLFGASLVTNPVTTTSTTTSTSSCSTKCDNDDSCNFLVISGSNSTGRAKTDWMAENFLLPRDFKSVISFAPKVQNVVVDFHAYVGLDRWVKGLYFRLYGPVNWNRATLKPSEALISAGTATGTPPTNTNIGGGYPQGFFDPATLVATQSLFTSALQFFGGCQLPKYTNESVTVQPLMFAKFSDCPTSCPTTTPTSCNSDNDDNNNNSRRHKTGFAELRGEFGWNYLADRYRFLINVQAAAPTGSRPNAEFLFPAQVGNGKHWELGLGIGGAWKMWCSEDEEKSFNFIVEADITHLFGAKQMRTFDLIGKPNSRYMLAEKIGTPATGAAPLDGSTVQFINVYAPVANFSTQEVKVKIGVQGDVVAMFNFSVRGFSWDFGYNFWGMSKSKIKLSDDCSCPFPANTWALKGDASVAGETIVGTTITNVNLAATESGATIFASQGFNASSINASLVNSNITTTPPINATNTAIDNPVLAASGGNEIVAFAVPLQMFTSQPPVFISMSNLDIDGARQRGLSHKVFTHFSYTFSKYERWLPYIGVGASAQFGSHRSGDCSTSTTTCPKPTTTNSCDNDSNSVSCALSNWAIFVKGGVSFH